MKLIYSLLFICVLSCSTIKLANGKQYFSGKKISYNLSSDWNLYKNSNTKYYYTKDGFKLNSLDIYVLDLNNISKKNYQKISKNMELFDLAEIIKNEIETERHYKFLTNIKVDPYSIGDIEAILITFDAEHGSGYETKHQLISYQNKFKTIIIEFSAAKRVYYDKYLDEFKRVLSSYKDVDYNKK